MSVERPPRWKLIEGIIFTMVKRVTSQGIASLVILVMWAALFSACRPTPPVTTGVPTHLPDTPTTSPWPEETATSFEPSPTPLPVIALVNGENIFLVAFQAELARYTTAIGSAPTPEDENRVLDELINLVLLAQGATEQGFSVSSDLLDERMLTLETELGGKQALLDWMAAHSYQESDFRADLQRAIAAAWMRDQIAEAIPHTTEQVHARQILLTNSEEAAQILARLQNGADFSALAAEYDPLAKGDLGWFPPGSLLDPQLDKAVFALQPGELTPILQSVAGYHIFQLIERDAQRPLDPSARLALQKLALQNWLEEKRSQSDIQIFKP